MSSFDKTVKLACKPKAAVPKSKYLDPIITATWSDDGAVHDVCKALVPRIREPNAIVVFKALIVLHTMIRAGSTDNVLSYLSSSNALKLRDISSASWEGYTAPQNLQNYALYLESRISAYKDLKHDAIKVQSESNRDMRNSMSIEEHSRRGRKDRKTEASAPTRSKTVMGRKLRLMAVEKGLLRETKVVHRMVDALVECRFYLDNLEDELAITALQMLVKDLLILFQASNEAVINILERYFEMSHIDAEEALKLYRRFCKQTENVVEFLGVAKKLQNLLNVPIPNLKHAPVSLAGALQDYLNDPNFEQHRNEYRTNKAGANRGTAPKDVKSSSQTSEVDKSLESSQAQFGGKPELSSSVAGTKNRGTEDFFSAIEEEQVTNFVPQISTYSQQQAMHPFTQMLNSQPTGFPSLQSTVPMQVNPNPFSGFLLPPQPTSQPSLITQQPIGVPTMFHPQPTGGLQVPQLLQPQMTGSNPFRQSMLFPQTTGMQLFGVGNSPVIPSFQHSQTMMSHGQSPTGLSPMTSVAAPLPQFGSISSTNGTMPVRPSSTPLTSSTAASPSSTIQPIKSHQTGTKNPFGSVSPPVPRPPTLFELSTGSHNQNHNQKHTPVEQQPSQFFNFAQSSLNPGAVDISSVASSFAFVNNKPSTNFSATTNSASYEAEDSKTKPSSTSGLNSFISTSHTTGEAPMKTSTMPFTTSTTTLSPINSQMTGFGSLKPFKPTSTFGASLLESLPPIAGSGSTTPTNGSAISKDISQARMANPTGVPGFSSTTGIQNTFNTSLLKNQPTGATGEFGTRSTLGVGLRPQLTGATGANPFRASMAPGVFFNAPPMPALPQTFGSMNGGPVFSPAALGSQGQQPNAATSLI